MNKFKLQHVALATTLAFAVGAANAGVMHSVAYGTSTDTVAQTAEQAFLSSLWSSTTENFEDLDDLYTYASSDKLGQQYVDGDQQDSWLIAANSFDTKVGKFTLSDSAATQNDDEEPEKLMIEGEITELDDHIGQTTGEFGRHDDAGNWLDSNDANEVKWDIGIGGGNFNALGFYLSDANDQGAKLVLNYDNGTDSETISITPPTKPNGNAYNGNLAYVSIWSDIKVASAKLIFDNGSDENDGFSIDGATVGRVPEPGTLALLGLGIAGLTAARRKQKA